jgi:hypothetical protein
MAVKEEQGQRLWGCTGGPWVLDDGFFLACVVI